MQPIIYHNPKCGTSRGALALLREKGFKPKIILYLETPPSEREIREILRKAASPARALLRAKEPAAKERNLTREGVSEEALISAMAKTPILMNRPIILYGEKAVLARPAERALSILPASA